MLFFMEGGEGQGTLEDLSVWKLVQSSQAVFVFISPIAKSQGPLCFGPQAQWGSGQWHSHPELLHVGQPPPPWAAEEVLALPLGWAGQGPLPWVAALQLTPPSRRGSLRDPASLASAGPAGWGSELWAWGSQGAGTSGDDVKSPCRPLGQIKFPSGIWETGAVEALWGLVRVGEFCH